MPTQTDLFVLQTYGPWILLGLYLIRDVWWFLRDKLFPSLIKRAERQDELSLSLEERQTRAFEKIAENVQQLAVLYATISAHTESTANGVRRIETALAARAHDPADTKPLSKVKRVKVEG